PGGLRRKDPPIRHPQGRRAARRLPDRGPRPQPLQRNRAGLWLWLRVRTEEPQRSDMIERSPHPKFRLLVLSSDPFPPTRVDVSVLFGEELAGRGHQIDWILQSEADLDRPD